MGDKALLMELKKYVMRRKKYFPEYSRFRSYIPQRHWKFYTSRKSMLNKSQATIFLIRMAYLAGIDEKKIIKFAKLNSYYELLYIADPSFFYLINIKDRCRYNSEFLHNLFNRKEELTKKFVNIQELRKAFSMT